MTEYLQPVGFYMVVDPGAKEVRLNFATLPDMLQFARHTISSPDVADIPLSELEQMLMDNELENTIAEVLERTTPWLQGFEINVVLA